MKKLNFLFFIILLIGCSKDDSNPIDALPAETQIGANTFGVLIDGKVYKPRCEKPSVVFPIWGMLLEGSYSSIPYSNQIIVKDLKSEDYFEFTLHLHEIKLLGTGIYQIDESNGNSSIDGLNNNYINCTLFDRNTNKLKRFVSYHNSGSYTITSYTQGSDFTGTLISGTFFGHLRNINNPDDKIQLTNGRFDINGQTCIFKEFK